jgi:nitroreductase
MLQGACGMEFRDVIYGRRSVRAYEQRSVEDLLLNALVDAAIQAPSAVNEQPWAFTVITDQVLLQRISNGAKTYLLQTSALGMGPSRFRDQLSDPDFHIFYHAPALILISAIGATPWAVEDCALAAQNLMLSAYANGLGSCWIGFAQHWLQTPDGRAMLDLPNHYVPVAPIIVGYPKATPDRVKRRPPTVKWKTGKP